MNNLIELASKHGEITSYYGKKPLTLEFYVYEDFEPFCRALVAPYVEALQFYSNCQHFETMPDGSVHLHDHGCVADKALAAHKQMFGGE